LFGSTIDSFTNASSGWPALAADSFRLSSDGPTLPFAPGTAEKVWHATQPLV
jgi:hypothetical protein